MGGHHHAPLLLSLYRPVVAFAGLQQTGTIFCSSPRFRICSRRTASGSTSACAQPLPRFHAAPRTSTNPCAHAHTGPNPCAHAYAGAFFPLCAHSGDGFCRAGGG